MLRHSLSAGILLISVAGSALVAVPAEAQTPLTRAVVSALRNRVRLLPRLRPARPAKISDVVKPGDGLSTARSSLAELRFNDGTLARMGERAVFRFVPQTRRFRLTSGTVLLLIPPGQGRTQVRTPNVTAGIRGSALFLRYAPDTNTTIVGALTDSGIEVMNSDGSQQQVLKAGQMVVTVGDKIEGLYDFDLETFYETSSLVEGLELDDPRYKGEDEAIAQVREETLDGLEQQRTLPSNRFAAGSVLENPDFTNLSTIASTEDTAFPGRAIGGVDPDFADADQPFVPPAVTPPRNPAIVPVPPPVVVADPPSVIEAEQPVVVAAPEPAAVFEPEQPVIVADPELPVGIMEPEQPVIVADPEPPVPDLGPPIDVVDNIAGGEDVDLPDTLPELGDNFPALLPPEQETADLTPAQPEIASPVPLEADSPPDPMVGPDPADPSDVVNDILVEDFVQETEQPPVQEPEPDIVADPVVEDPIAEDPIAEDPIAEDPIAEDPITQEPIAEEPIAEEPITQEPEIQEPITEPEPSPAPNPSENEDFLIDGGALR